MAQFTYYTITFVWMTGNTFVDDGQYRRKDALQMVEDLKRNQAIRTIRMTKHCVVSKQDLIWYRHADQR